MAFYFKFRRINFDFGEEWRVDVQTNFDATFEREWMSRRFCSSGEYEVLSKYFKVLEEEPRCYRARFMKIISQFF